MGLVVSAHVVRDLIGDGEYTVECLEQREHGRVVIALTLRARAALRHPDRDKRQQARRVLSRLTEWAGLDSRQTPCCERGEPASTCG